MLSHVLCIKQSCPVGPISWRKTGKACNQSVKCSEYKSIRLDYSNLVEFQALA